MKRIDVEPELQAYAEAQHDKIRDRAGVELNALRDVGAPRLIHSNAPYRTKYIKLRELTDHAAALVAPQTPCKKGCSACCYQAVPISLNEARIIEGATGHRYSREAKTLVPAIDTMETIARFNANCEARLHDPTPCPFLVDDACSIYEVRPIPCRSHQVLHPDASRCKLNGKPLAQVKYDLTWTDDVAATIGIEDRWADIREFFPK